MIRVHADDTRLVVIDKRVKRVNRKPNDQPARNEDLTHGMLDWASTSLVSVNFHILKESKITSSGSCGTCGYFIGRVYISSRQSIRPHLR
jgi:hypothetical protein